jgi:hypothetical protein
MDVFLNDNTRLGWQNLLALLKIDKIQLDDFGIRSLDGSFFMPKEAVTAINEWLDTHNFDQQLEVLKELTKIYPAQRYSLAHSVKNFTQQLEDLSKMFDVSSIPYNFKLITDESDTDYLNTFKNLEEKKVIKAKAIKIVEGIPSSTLSLNILLAYNPLLGKKLMGTVPTKPEDSIETSNTSAALLPPLISNISGGYAIHEGNIISYNGKEIILEKRLGDLAAAIMKRSEKGLYTNKEYIADNVIDENKDYEAPQDYAVKLVSRVRKAFQSQLDSQHEYFKSRSGYGYKFTPVNTHENITK